MIFQPFPQPSGKGVFTVGKMFRWGRSAHRVSRGSMRPLRIDQLLSNMGCISPFDLFHPSFSVTPYFPCSYCASRRSATDIRDYNPPSKIIPLSNQNLFGAGSIPTIQMIPIERIRCKKSIGRIWECFGDLRETPQNYSLYASFYVLPRFPVLICLFTAA